jgi:hypothetical protein
MARATIDDDRSAPEDGTKEAFRLLLLLALLDLVAPGVGRELALLVHALVAESAVLDLPPDLGLDLGRVEDGIVGENLHQVLERDCACVGVGGQMETSARRSIERRQGRSPGERKRGTDPWAGRVG